MQRRLIMRLFVAGALALACTVLLIVAGGEPQASAACPFERTVTTQAELDETIVCYNAAVAGEKYVIVLGNEISLTGPLIFIDNSTTAELTISGEGNMIDGKGLADYVFRQNNGNVTVTSITLTGGAVAGFAAVGGPTIIEGSTLSGNENGLIAISLDGVTVRNSTLSANVVQGISNTGPLNVIVSTISDNGSDGIGFGVGVTISGSIVAKNMVEDCGTPVANDLGGNVFGTTDCNGVATPSVIDSLGTLGANGCSSPCTHTIALLANSPAIDAAGTCGVKDDQRGIERATDQCDAGAYEADNCLSSVTVATEVGLEFAVHCYNLAPAGATNTVFLGADITLTADLLSIDNSTSANLRLRGQGHTIDANGTAQNVLNQVSGDASIRNVTLTGGSIVGFRTQAGSTQIEDATISGNENGMVVLSSADVLLLNATIASNEQRGIGNTGSMTILSSTIVDNGSEGLLNGTDVVMADSIVARNLVEDCDNPIEADGGGNVFGSTSCNGVATSGLTISLGSLGANGCIAPCTETVALLPGSPAIDAAGGCTVTTDQRGEPRTADQCDAGAYEAADCSSATSVSTESDLAYAIGCYNSDPADTAWFVTLAGDVTLTSDLLTIDNDAGATLEIDGAGHMIDAAGQAEDVLYMTDGDLSLYDVTLTGAVDNGFHHAGGSARIDRSTMTGNQYGVYGESAGGTTVRNSTIQGNFFGGVVADNPLSIISSTIVDNGGDGIDHSNGAVTLAGSLVARNGGFSCNAALPTASVGNVFEDDSCAGLGSGTASVVDLLGLRLAPNGCAAPCTETIALLAGSPAIDAAGDCGLATDQRGVARTVGRCDAGAFEFGDLMCNGKLVTIRAQAGVTTFGTTGDDVILGTVGDDVINALEGDDTVCALAGDDTVDTGPGNDTVFGDAGLDVILGLDGNDTLHGGDGRDIMRGGPGVDVLNGGNGNDRILGGIGNDVLNGEAGNDYLGGFGGNDTINGGPGDETIFGGFGADIINGGGGNDAIFGLIGNDVINGGAGNDKLNGDRGNDTINGGPGDDVISGGNANDILSGDDGDDIVSGGKADDTLAGNDGIDTCIGNLQNTADTADTTCEFIFGVP